MAMSDGGSTHRPVLYKEIIHVLRPVSKGSYVDGTLGAGGHAWGILEASSPDGRLLGLDLDPQALEIARRQLAPFGGRAVLIQSSYANLEQKLAELGWECVDGVLLDLGLSSMQLDAPDRGFSFLSDAPLDMRFDPGNPLKAAALVNTLSETELVFLLRKFGEEPHARRIARAIVSARPIESTGRLAQVILQAVGAASPHQPGGREHIHPATRTFQALRIAVNQELDALEKALPQIVRSLKPGGLVAIISFHSLEDRIVKQFMRRESQDCICPPRQPICTCGHVATLKELTRHPIRPQVDEILQNPRSRSARLRVAERL